MSLPPPAPRTPIHDRRIECRGWRRDDGLWDIEGHLVDTKHYGFDNAWRGRMEPGMPVHEMRLRLTLDDTLTVREAVAATAASPYEICPAAGPDYGKLAGLRIGPGFRTAVLARLGGRQGCTHLTELLWPLATTAYQTIFPALHRDRPRSTVTERPKHLDSCHALAVDGPVVARFWPQFHEPQAGTGSARS